MSESETNAYYTLTLIGKRHGLDPLITVKVLREDLPNLWARFWMFVLFGWRFKKTVKP